MNNYFKLEDVADVKLSNVDKKVKTGEKEIRLCNYTDVYKNTYIDKNAGSEKIVLMDASKLGETVKEGKNQRTVLSAEEEQKIIDTFNQKQAVEDFSVVVSAEEIKAKNYSFSAGQYFEIKIEYVEIYAEEFTEKMNNFETTLTSLFEQSNQLDKEILENFKKLNFKG